MNLSPLIEVRNLKVDFSIADNHKLYAVNGVNLNIYPGETLGIVGESGSGKSQTMLSIMGLLAKNATVAGEAIFGNKNLLSLSKKEINKIRGKDIAMIFQDPMTSLNPYLKIKTQLMEVLTNTYSINKKEATNKIIEMLNMVGIAEPESRLNNYPHQISGGMRQRVMISMALLSNPKLLIADEPTTALDVTIQSQILNLLAKLKEKFKLSIVLVTHDLGVVANLCDRVAIFYGGKVVEVGDVFTIFNYPGHPYTQALLKSIPRVDKDRNEKLSIIPGSPKVWKEEPKLCVFKDRCVKKITQCEKIAPKLLKSNNGNQVSCLLEGNYE